MSRPVSQVVSDETLLLRDDVDGVTTLTLNRPKQYNALSEAMLAALQQTLDEIAQDSSVRVVILAGAG
ncbi:MAG: enoyl-CoA hydratase/isomerase family protein, partial [Gammaproteobacteria bacterium]|nr:enoyl-CoA hydratase/isomerase family protein [Gammaproteobacteria bacterium]